jgi:hypothetical protein
MASAGSFVSQVIVTAVGPADTETLLMEGAKEGVVKVSSCEGIRSHWGNIRAGAPDIVGPRLKK